MKQKLSQAEADVVREKEAALEWEKKCRLLEGEREGSGVEARRREEALTNRVCLFARGNGRGEKGGKVEGSGDRTGKGENDSRAITEMGKTQRPSTLHTVAWQAHPLSVC